MFSGYKDTFRISVFTIETAITATDRIAMVYRLCELWYLFPPF